MSLHNVCNIGDMSISEKLEANLISFFDWGFVDRGGYTNVNLNQTGCYSNNRSVLKYIQDSRVPNIKKYYGPGNWVYETDISSSPAPNIVPLVYVNNALDTSATINYRDGYVIPSVTVPTNGVVKASYSYKWATFTSSKKGFNLKRFIHRHTRDDLDDSNNKVLPEITVPLPCVSINVPSISKSRPHGIDRLGPRIYTFNVAISVIAESHSEVCKISDYICMQQGTNFSTYDPKLVVMTDDFPLNFDGTINSGKNHKQLSEDYPWSTVYIEEAYAIDGNYIHQNIYESFVRLKLELVSCFGC